MKLKYYLRGLGTGIAVTALIIGISSGASDKNIITDEEILARAKQLGLVERTVLSDMVNESEESDIKETDTEGTKTEEIKTDEADVDVTDTGEHTTEELVEEEPEIEGTVDVPEADASNANDIIMDSEEFGMPDEAGTITITIVRGDSSDSVSRLLEEAGLVDSATAYDKYLCQNGYDKSIRTGNYEIPADATGEEIAKMITGR